MKVVESVRLTVLNQSEEVLLIARKKGRSLPSGILHANDFNREDMKRRVFSLATNSNIEDLEQDQIKTYPLCGTNRRTKTANGFVTMVTCVKRFNGEGPFEGVWVPKESVHSRTLDRKSADVVEFLTRAFIVSFR